MRRYLLYFLLFCSFIFSVSCNKDKLKAPKASFLVVNNVTLKTTTGQGSNSHKITDMWYYVDGQFKGAFPVGSVMPIVAKDNAEITLFAGIKNNGISATRVPYAAYSSKVFNLDIEPGKTYTLSPEFEYNSTAYFYYHDEFDAAVGTGTYFVSDDNSNCSTTFDPSQTFGGTGGSILMTMTDATPKARLLQNTGSFLPAGGSTIYLELNYKCNQPFVVGVIGSYDMGVEGTDQRGAVTLNASSEWNKVYVQLTSIVSAQPNYPYYRVYMEAVKQSENPEIYIDNVKLIYQ